MLIKQTSITSKISLGTHSLLYNEYTISQLYGTMEIYTLANIRQLFMLANAKNKIRRQRLSKENGNQLL